MGGRNSALLCYFFMIRNLITATLVAIAPINKVNNINRTGTTVHTQVSQFSTIMTNSNVIKDEEWATNDGQPYLEAGRYYVIKELQSTPLELLNKTVLIKGYQYTILDEPNEQNYQIIDYYIRVESTLSDYTFENLEFIFNGTNGSELYYQDYYFQYTSSSSMPNIDTFLLSNNYTLNQLDTLKNTTLTNLTGSNAEIDTVDANASITTPTNYKYYRWRLEMRIDDPTTITPQNAINDTAHYYENVKVVYFYNTNVEIHQEVIDLPGLLFSILGMPFAWISTAFNLTIFPGTPYAVNLSHLFIAIIGALILIIILKKILK